MRSSYSQRDETPCVAVYEPLVSGGKDLVRLSVGPGCLPDLGAPQGVSRALSAVVPDGLTLQGRPSHFLLPATAFLPREGIWNSRCHVQDGQ